MFEIKRTVSCSDVGADGELTLGSAICVLKEHSPVSKGFDINMERIQKYGAENIKDKINETRRQLNILIDIKAEDIIASDVMNLSWELDKLIVE